MVYVRIIVFHIFPPKVGAEGEKGKPLGAEGSEKEEDCHTVCIGGGRSQEQVPFNDSQLILLVQWTIWWLLSDYWMVLGTCYLLLGTWSLRLHWRWKKPRAGSI